MKKNATLKFVESLVLPVVLGLVSGISGGMVGYAIVTAELEAERQIDLGGRTRPVSTAPLPETEIASRLRSMTLPVFRRSDVPPAGRPDLALTASDALGYAAAVTSDGWLVTVDAVAAGPVSVGIEGKFKEPVAVVKDERTGLVFLKIENGPLQVSAFEETEVMPPGTPLYAYDEAQGFAGTVFSGAEAVSAVRSSESFSRVFRLDRAFGPAASGAPVVTASGNLAGVVGEGGFIPVHLVRPVMAKAFRGQPMVRASFGVRYVDLSSAYLAEGQGLAGARLVRDRAAGRPAVAAGSPAAEAGLREGDVILRVGDTALTGGTDLAEVVAEYEPGASALIEVLSGTDRRFVEVAFE